MSDCIGVMTIDKIAMQSITIAQQRALLQTADYVAGDVIQKQLIPFDYGTLQNSRYVYTEDNDAIIQHNTPYARFIYLGDNLNFQTVNNKNARAKWYQEYENGGNEYYNVEKFFSSRLKENAARYVE